MVIQPITVRKVPIEVIAVQWDGTTLPLDDLNQYGADLSEDDVRITRDGLRIRTLHGFSYAVSGDWLIIAPWGGGVSGEAECV